MKALQVLKLLKQERRFLGLSLAKVIALLVILFAGYYVLFLAPRLALPNAYLETQKIFAEHRTNLVQNRVALVELAQLSIGAADLFNKEMNLLQKLQETNKVGLQSLKENQQLPRVAGLSNLAAALPLLLEKERQILKEQQGLIVSLTNLNSATGDLLRYNAKQNLGSPDLIADSEQLQARKENAKDGLEKIASKLDAIEVSSETLELLQSEIQKTQNLLQGNTSVTLLISQFEGLKELALDIQREMIRSDQSVKLLTHQTNLILEYDFWLKRISVKQAQLAQD
ncbi:hypothetical protein IH982_00020 [Patescibacteria group bacterium]|nr:hypothetical protein [Patescibacteria group bacterium]